MAFVWSELVEQTADPFPQSGNGWMEYRNSRRLGRTAPESLFPPLKLI